jgi:uncharacterized protein
VSESQFLYRLQAVRPDMVAVGPSASEEPVLVEHFAYLKALAERGVLLLAGRTLDRDESAFGIVIFRADTEREARRIMLADPAVKAGVMRARLFPYRVALVGPLGEVTGQG